MTTQHDKPKRWRPWQFSLRALLLLMLVVASYLGGWMSNEWKRQREMERAQQEAEQDLPLSGLIFDMPVPDISDLPEPQLEVAIPVTESATDDDP